jgi:hypothetical protein
MTTALKATLLAAAIALVAPVAANASTDGTSNTVLVAESVAHQQQAKWTFSDVLVESLSARPQFMDYIDDV